METHDTQLAKLLLLQRVAQRINSILDLDVLLEEIIDDLARTFGYTRTAVLLLDEDRPEELVIAAARGWTRFHEKGFRFKVGREGMVGQVASSGRIRYAPDVRADPHYVVSEESTRSEVDVPIRARDRLIGVLNAQSSQVDGFGRDQLQLLEVLAGHVGTAIENARLFERQRREKERLTRELEAARTIQEALLPRSLPDISGFEVTGTCLPCREVGGDWYDCIPLSEGRVGVVAADVSGKGMGAAFLMSSARSMLRLVAERGGPPGEVLSELNRRLLEDLPAARFISMVYVVLDPRDPVLVLANAGHPWPLLVDSVGARYVGDGGGLPLGIRPGPYPEQRIELTTGGRLFLYSDGVTEATDPSGEEYGAARFRDEAASADSSIETVLAALRRFRASAPVTDDITLVRVRRTAPAFSKAPTTVPDTYD